MSVGRAGQRVCDGAIADAVPSGRGRDQEDAGGTALLTQLLSFNVALAGPPLVLAGVLVFRWATNSRAKNLGRIGIGLGLMLMALAGAGSLALCVIVILAIEYMDFSVRQASWSRR